MVCPIIKQTCVRLAQEVYNLSADQAHFRLAEIQAKYGKGTLRAVESLSGMSLTYYKKLQKTDFTQ